MESKRTLPVTTQLSFCIPVRKLYRVDITVNSAAMQQIVLWCLATGETMVWEASGDNKRLEAKFIDTLPTEYTITQGFPINIRATLRTGVDIPPYRHLFLRDESPDSAVASSFLIIGYDSGQCDPALERCRISFTRV